MDHEPTRPQSRQAAIDHVVSIGSTAWAGCFTEKNVRKTVGQLLSKSLDTDISPGALATALLQSVGLDPKRASVLRSFSAKETVDPAIGRELVDLATVVFPPALAAQAVVKEVTELTVEAVPHGRGDLRSRVMSPLTDLIVAEVLPQVGFSASAASYEAALRSGDRLQRVADRAIAAYTRDLRAREDRAAAALPGHEQGGDPAHAADCRAAVEAVDEFFVTHHGELTRLDRRLGDLGGLADAWINLHEAAERRPDLRPGLGYVRRAIRHAAIDQVAKVPLVAPHEEEITDRRSLADQVSAETRHFLWQRLVVAVERAEPEVGALLVRVFCEAALGSRIPKLSDAIVDLLTGAQVRDALKTAAREGGLTAGEARVLADRALEALRAADQTSTGDGDGDGVAGTAC